MQKGVSFENLFSRFRTSYYSQHINQVNRVCNLCQSRELEDEYHYVFECTEITITEPGGFLKHADVDQM
jgi:hypothetical protein